MDQELSKVYEPAKLQTQAMEIWNNGKFFHAEPTNPAKAYTIVIPPPNVTAALHLGHALNNTLQDILVRYHRMSGDNTLWMPGTDHAGIATQTVVEKRLLAETGKRRTDFQREDFIAHVQAWKDEYQTKIIHQLKAMGCSCDFGRIRFTMDEVCAKAVRETFFKLFNDGLIYRGKRLVNWDPATQTVLADDEVEHELVQGHFWYLNYKLKEPVEVDGEKIEYVTVATTRPETMLGDSAVAMNPSDKRAKALVGKTVILPIVGREIPIIADEHVVIADVDSDDEKAKFGTGFLKVTPAHDPNDWEIGLRHDLPVINVMAPDASISNKYGWQDCSEDAQFLLGMDRFQARKAIVEWFKKEKLLADIREYAHEIGHSYRSHVPIEPYLSDQWYVAVKKPIEHLAKTVGSEIIPDSNVPVNSLAGLALKPLLDGKLKFTPVRYAKTYQSWLENLRDWPISRQLWWGHQIPIWSKQGKHQDLPKENISSQIVETEDGYITFICIKPGCEETEQQLKQQGWVRDEDVLDTWFSSALWPFSTMGWPEDTQEMKKYYPGNVLCTAREIITLWVSRMVMMGQYCVGDIPFEDVYIHAMIQDGDGRKMSKSLGNGIDPLVVIDSHGSDAMRFTLASMTTDTQDVRMPVEPIVLPDGREVNTSPKFDNSRNFCNKLWNASRFAMMNLDSVEPGKFNIAKLKSEDKWILSKLGRTIREVTEMLDAFKFSEPANAIYKFFWNDLCDWYLEWIKPRMKDDADKDIAQNVLAFVLDNVLRLMHPFTPFISEAIFQSLRKLAAEIRLDGIADAENAEALAIAKWPVRIDDMINDNIEKDIDIIQSVIRAIRDVRSKYNIKPSKKLDVIVNAPDKICQMLDNNSRMIYSGAGLASFKATAKTEKPQRASVSIIDDMSVFVLDAVNPEAEKQKLEKQKENLVKQIKGVEAKLNNENFVKRAKPEVVEQAKNKYAELKEQLQAVEKYLANI